MKAHSVPEMIARTPSTATVENTSGMISSVRAASIIATVARACSSVLMNGIFCRTKRTLGNCCSIMLPSVSAEMPVPPATKKTGVGATEPGSLTPELSHTPPAPEPLRSRRPTPRADDAPPDHQSDVPVTCRIGG